MAEVDQSKKDLALHEVGFYAGDYENALCGVRVHRGHLAEACKKAHDAGATDREIAEVASGGMARESLTRGRIQQLRTSVIEQAEEA